MKDSSRLLPSEKLKLLCSFNGRFQPCSPLGNLRYVDGETRIVSMEARFGLSRLVSKVSQLHHLRGRDNNNLLSFSIIYRHEEEEEDCPLVPVTCDNDVKCMIDEYYRKLETLGKEPRLWIFVCYSDNCFRFFKTIAVFNGESGRDWKVLFDSSAYAGNSDKIRDQIGLDCNEVRTGYDSVYCSNKLDGRYYPVKQGYGIDVDGGIRSLKFAVNNAENLRDFSYNRRNVHRETLMKMGSRKFSRVRGRSTVGQHAGVRVSLDVSKRGHTVRPNHHCPWTMPLCSRNVEKTESVTKTDNEPEDTFTLKLPYGNGTKSSNPEGLLSDETNDLISQEVTLNDQLEVLKICSHQTPGDGGGRMPFVQYQEMAEENNKKETNQQDPIYNNSTGKDDTRRNKHTKLNGGWPSDHASFYTYLATKDLQTINTSDLEYVKVLGSGSYATVFYGKWKGSDVAIKKLRHDCFSEDAIDEDHLVADFWKEAHVLGQLHHPNIVSLYGVVTEGSVGDFAVVTEYMHNGSLKQVLRRKDRTIDYRKKMIIAMDVAFGMEYLHANNIVHFDLKSYNFFVNMRDPLRPVCKIGDLGLSKIKQRTLVSGGMRGTIPWMAPELLSSKEMVDEKVDVYSFGIVMWELLTGEEPYVHMKSEEIIVDIIKGTLRPEIPNWCNPAWRSLMERCWASDPYDRPTFSEISKELQAMAASLNIK